MTWSKGEQTVRGASIHTVIQTQVHNVRNERRCWPRACTELVLLAAWLSLLSTLNRTFELPVAPNSSSAVCLAWVKWFSSSLYNKKDKLYHHRSRSKYYSSIKLPSVIWRCWLSNRNGIWLTKTPREGSNVGGWDIIWSTLWATPPSYFKKKGIKSFALSHENCQENDWRLRINGATSYHRFT